MTPTKIKIVCICHFSNNEIQEILPLWKRVNEFAPYIPNMLKGFEDREDVDINVICPHGWLRRRTKIINREISYFFIPCGITFIHCSWQRFFNFDIYSNFYFFRRKVKKVINKIQPDIINLIGAENAYYSSVILDYKNSYPVLITIQWFISQMRNSVTLFPEVKKNIEIE